MKHIFVDSNFYIASVYNEDSLHTKALSLSLKLKSLSSNAIISNWIFLEVVTVTSQRLTRKDSIKIGNYLRKTVEIIRIDQSLEEKTWEIFKQIKDKDVSFVDCSTLVVLKEKKIGELVTFDHHFQKLSQQFAFSVIS